MSINFNLNNTFTEFESETHDWIWRVTAINETENEVKVECDGEIWHGYEGCAGVCPLNAPYDYKYLTIEEVNQLVN
jgi:hypothetical protein